MFELKLLTKVAVPKALERAERYRFLNEPGEAESICLDVLRVEPDNQKALITLLLALTDQIEHGSDIRRRARSWPGSAAITSRPTTPGSSASGGPRPS